MKLLSCTKLGGELQSCKVWHREYVIIPRGEWGERASSRSLARSLRHLFVRCSVSSKRRSTRESLLQTKKTSGDEWGVTRDETAVDSIHPLPAVLVHDDSQFSRSGLQKRYNAKNHIRKKFFGARVRTNVQQIERYFFGKTSSAIYVIFT